MMGSLVGGSRWLGVVAAVCAAVLAAAETASGRTTAEFIVTPRTLPKAVSAAMAAMPAGSRSIKLRGFADDIAAYDWLTTPARSPKSGVRASATRVQSPWLDAGIKVVNSRVTAYMTKLVAANASIDGFTVEMPAAIVGTRLADLTLPNWKLIAADPRAAALAQTVRIGSIAELGSRQSAIDQWRSAAPARAEAILSLAVDSAVRKIYPRANGPVRNTTVPMPIRASIPAQVPVTTVAGSTSSPTTVPPATAPVTTQATSSATAPSTTSGSTTAGSTTSASSSTGSTATDSTTTGSSTTGATAPTSEGTSGSGSSSSSQGVPTTTTSAQATEAARMVAYTRNYAMSVLSDASRGRRTSDWTGTLAYPGTDWNAIFALSQASPPLRQYLFSLDGSARTSIAAPSSLYRRPATLADINSTILDARAASLGGNREQFALAMADCSQADFVRTKGVELALMAVYTNNPDYLSKSIEMLDAMLEHQPLQRPGWTLTSATSQLPAGGDGVWLATHWGISGIVDMLNILGDRVPPSTRESLKTMLRAEVERIVRDWADKRPWYVRGRTITSNQWIEPNVGLVKACLYLGDPELLAAYNMGVENLAMTIEALGADGAFLEGFSYASMTLGPLFDVLRDLKSNGDLRCHGFPFVNNAWRWMLQMHMPGRQLVNSYDSRMSRLPDWAVTTPLPSLASAALASSDPAAMQTLKSLFPKGIGSIAGIRYEAAMEASAGTAELPTFAFFQSQQQLVWRTAWQAPAAASQTALGMWLRGGSSKESHTHRDQGQVSIYCGNRIVLMDCGTPDYSDPQLNEKYAQAAGHGIMQIGELLPRGTAVNAPVSVNQLSATGGSAKIDTTAAYRGVTLCTREVTWSESGAFAILDNVALASTAPAGTEFYRFHAGTADPVAISGGGSEWTVSWRGTSMRISADRAITVDQVDWPDATRAPFHHQAIIIRASAEGQGLTLSTQISVDRSIVD